MTEFSDEVQKLLLEELRRIVDQEVRLDKSDVAVAIINAVVTIVLEEYRA